MVSSLNAQSTLVIQEKCSDAARALFLRIHPTTAENDETRGQCLWAHECHYNEKLDKCFIFLHGMCKKKDESYNLGCLVDVFEEKVYADYRCKFRNGGVLEWRTCFLGDTQFNVNKNGFEFNKQTKKWDIVSEAYIHSLKNPFSDPMKEKFDKWVKPYMEE